jgi:xylono-1,5-lactonase
MVWRMKSDKPICVWPVGAELGEGPIWLPDERALYFVDIKARHIHRFSGVTGDTQTWRAPDQPGFIAPLEGHAFVCGLRNGLHRFETSNGSFRLMREVESHLPGNRLNDGTVDAAGRLWFGSMDDAEIEETGSLYRVGNDGRVAAPDRGYVITNGPAFSPDGTILYHGDTLRRVVYAFDVDAQGNLARKRKFTEISGDGYPDGLAVDSEGFVWIALFGGARIERFSPDGTLVGQVRFPCSNVTKIAFGGDDMRTVYATTAWKGLSAEERKLQSLAGGLFAFRSPVAGQVPVRCSVLTD